MSPLGKQLARRTLRSPAFAGAVRLLDCLHNERPDHLRVLTYHRVDDAEAQPDLAPQTLSATPGEFARQMALLASDFHVVSMAEVLDAVRQQRGLPERSVLITFDDAYSDFAQHAWPVLQHYRLPATLFVPTAFPDQHRRAFWWDRLFRAVCRAPAGRRLVTPWGPVALDSQARRWKLYQRLCRHVEAIANDAAQRLVERICADERAGLAPQPVLSWAKLRRLAREGVTLGAHTQTHPLMTKIPLEQAAAEAIGSRADLQQQVGQAPPIFAYPNGACDANTARMLADNGFLLAFTTRRGANHLAASDRCRLRRINVGRSTTATVLRAQLLLPAKVFNRLCPAPCGC